MVKQREKTIKNNDNKNKKRKLELNMPYNYVNYFRDKSFNKSLGISILLCNFAHETI